VNSRDLERDLDKPVARICDALAANLTREEAHDLVQLLRSSARVTSTNPVTKDTIDIGTHVVACDHAAKRRQLRRGPGRDSAHASCHALATVTPDGSSQQRHKQTRDSSIIA